MTLNATYSTTTPAFRLTDAPTTGVALPATDPSQYGNRPLAVYLQATVANIRFTTDGSTPTSSHGMLLLASAAPFYYTGPLTELRFIQAASDAILNVMYSQNPVSQGADGLRGPQGPGGGPQLFVDVVLDPVTLTTAPYYDSAHSGPGLVVIPAPAADEIILPWVEETTTPGDAWGSDSNVRMNWGGPNGTRIDSQIYINTLSDYLPDDPALTYVIFSLIDPTKMAAMTPEDWLPTAAGKAVTLHSRTNCAVGGVFGTKSIVIRIFYRIYKVTPSTVSSFFHITALNQGTKTLTVNGDAHTLSGSIAVVGSTGNDAAYTIVSATFVTDHTDIVVAQAVPSATADGWVKQ